jgi:ABC-type multidrug transport system ATPase subunit
MPLLNVRNLSRQPLLSAVTFSLEGGQCLGLEGPSGSGKSVLLRAVSDLDPSEGEVLLDGVARSTMKADDWRRSVAYVAAEPAWWGEEVGDHFEDRDEGARFAALLGLDGAMDWPVARLSTGEGQRLSLARTLAIAPRVLLLDEPTSGLDAGAAKHVTDVLRRFLSEGGAIILVAHDPGLLDHMATCRFAMKAGHLTEKV